MIVLVCWCTSMLMAQQYHYYYQGQQVPLDLNTSYAYLLLDGVQSQAEVQALVPEAKVSVFAEYHAGATLDKTDITSEKTVGDHWAEIQFTQQADAETYFGILKRLEGNSKVVSTSPYFSSEKDRSERLGISNLLMVKLKDESGEKDLVKLASELKVEIVGRNRFMPMWYTLSVDKNSAGNAMEVANMLYESKRFVTAEPDLLVDDLTNCVTDPLFVDQWGHDNTTTNPGTAGIDINACSGWANWGYGSSAINIAVLDHGFEQNHPDLMANNVGTGWNTTTGTSPALVSGSHGTACAGIVAADQNNGLGVSGVAPDCGIISISHPLFISPTASQELADGLNWAWQNGADVISNSWGHVLLTSTLIDDAIDNCLNNGRGGLGTVVCFAAGNANGAVIYPANSNPLIMCVGAMSPCGERKNPSSCDLETWWGSCFGNEVDVVAPGVLVPTTDRQGSAGYNTASGTAGDYAPTFNGTSAATPHVAGLAGLILSLNPCMTQLQVCNVIERTAQPIGGYPYASFLTRPNGPWHSEMGYGLIDIDAGMRMTRELYIQNITIASSEVYQVHGKIFAGNNVDPLQMAGDVNIISGADVDFKASTSITLDPGFNVNLGAEFDAMIITTACGDWDNTASRLAAPSTTAAIDQQAAENTASPLEKTSSAVVTLKVIPNPFNDQLTLRYDLPSEAKVQAFLFNSQGQKVKQLVNETVSATGHHQKVIELGEPLPAGIYFLRFQAGEKVFTEKLLKQ